MACVTRTSHDRRLDPALVERLDPHQRIIGMRHILVHAYFNVQPEILWYVVTENVGPLIAQVNDLLADR